MIMNIFFQVNAASDALQSSRSSMQTIFNVIFSTRSKKQMYVLNPLGQTEINK